MLYVECRECRLQIKVKKKLAGRKVACKCGHVMRMPDSLSGGAEKGSHESLIRFSCTNCKKKLQVKSSFAGRSTKCKCGATLQIPSPVQIQEKESRKIPVAEPFEDLLAEVVEDPLGELQSAEPMYRLPPPKKATYNPYSAPTSFKKPKRRNSNSETEQVISGQKLLIFALAMNLCMNVFVILMNLGGEHLRQMEAATAKVIAIGLLLVLVIVALCSIAMAIIGLIRMGRIVAPGWWILIIPLMCVPCVSLIMIVIINARATGYLRAKGIDVGFFGAR